MSGWVGVKIVGWLGVRSGVYGFAMGIETSCGVRY